MAQFYFIQKFSLTFQSAFEGIFIKFRVINRTQSGSNLIIFLVKVLMISKLQIVLLGLVLLTTVSQAQDDVNYYSANVDINVNGQVQNLNFLLGFKTSNEDECDTRSYPKGCYLGWVQQYTPQSQKAVAGNRQQIQPAFTLSGVSNDNYTVKYRAGLGQEWAQLIYIWAEKSDIFGDKKQGTIFEPKRQIQLRDTEYLRSDFTRSISYEKGVISSQQDSYNLILPTDNQVDGKDQDSAQNDLLCNVRTLIQKKSTANQPEKIDLARQILKQGELKAITKAQIQELRAKPSINEINREDFGLNSQKDPVIDLTEIDKLQGQAVDIDPAFLFENPEKYQFIERRSIFVDIGSATAPAAVGSNIRALQSGSTYTLINKSYTLFSKTIFGKVVAVKIIAQCNLILSGGYYYINCFAKLQYTIFNNVKTITIYSYTKKINIVWNWSNTYSGSWSQSISIPLPPPVSFITINLYFSVNYWISINLSAKPIYFGYPFKYKAQAIVQTGLNTYASAAVRVVLVEGGVFLDGTLVKVGTDPSVTLSFYWWSKYINVVVSWYFWLHAFQYKWGFFWRYWKPFSWSGKKIIAQWNIGNGYYQKWQILYKSWNIYY